METVAISKKSRKKIQKFVAKGQKRALKAQKKTRKIVNELPKKTKKAYKKYTPKDTQKLIDRATGKKSSSGAVITAVAAGLIVIAALSALLKSTDKLIVTKQ